MNQQIEFLATGIAGFIFHSLIKLRSLKTDATAANLPFSAWKDYVLKDIYGILAALFSPFVWLLLFGEIAAQYQALEKFALTSFFVMGALGSYLLQLLLGQAKKQIRKVVDEKTNIADGVNQNN